MSNFKTGDRVGVVFDKDKKNEKIYTGTIGRIGGYIGLKGTRYPVKYDGEDYVETRYHYTLERLTNLVKECKQFEKGKMPNFLKPKTFNSCPFCNIAYDSDFSQEGWAEIEKKEFKISGLCAKCQKEFFK
jgi:hypothetical protein